ncbi:pyruvate formate-lyase 3-activating enzyme [Salmonella enterica subsp. enterica]|nr:pyruvate formate-lyase 3-activating enzyme [Salmonella enterica subsp. enterica]
MAAPRGCWKISGNSPPRAKKWVIRVPLIQGFNADEETIKAITDFAADELHVGEIHFLPYHTLGINKYHLLSQPYHARINHWMRRRYLILPRSTPAKKV